MPSPVMNDKTFAKARAEADAGWAAPGTDTRFNPPITDGPITPYVAYDRMTLSGTMTAIGVLFTVLLVGGVIGWSQVSAAPDSRQVAFPGWIIPVALVAMVIAIVTSFKPKAARFTAPLYALAQGVVVGAISHLYDIVYKGIVVAALGATVAVFAAMWFLYATKIIKVTDRFRRIVIGATLGVMLLYGVSLIISLFGGKVSFLSSSSGFSILFSLFVVGLAAFNLALDFDLIERGVKEGAPKYMEWYAGFGLMVTVVWLYLEILRLLAKLQDRR